MDRRSLWLCALVLYGCSESSSAPQPDSAADATSDSADVTSSDSEDVASDAPIACASALDCGDVSIFVCDPTTRTCKPADCDAKKACDAGKTCVHQAKGVTVGICLPSCDTPGAACEGGVCVGNPGRVPGYCEKRGTAKLGATCTETIFDTGCEDGVCRGGTCVAICDVRASTSPCPTGKICTATWDCSADASSADPATFETFCTKVGAPCNIESGTQKGQCISLSGYGANVCRRGCQEGVASSCPTGFVCATPAPLVAGGGIGVCMPALDKSACQDGGEGTCATCRATEEATGGCCAAESAACTSTECRSFVDCAIACKRDATCVTACATAAGDAAKLGTPLFLCLSAFGAPPGGACGDVCLGPAVCGGFDGPDTASTCTGCMTSSTSCRANGCYNGYYCDRAAKKCVAPSTITGCAGDAGADGG